MPKFCANLTWLFTEYPFMERFEQAADAGFEAVEVLAPYDVPVQDVVNALARSGLRMVLINCPPPNYTGGAPGYAAVPGSEMRFRSDFKRTLRYARALKVERVHVMAGEAEGLDATRLFVENLRWATAEADGLELTIEPLNPDDKPGYYLNDFDLAREVIDAVGASNLRLQFDAYHAQKIHGDVPGLWARMRDIVGHVQVAQTPNRSEPDAGEIDYPAFFARLDADGYSGWVSGEYAPLGHTRKGLGWMA